MTGNDLPGAWRALLEVPAPPFSGDGLQLVAARGGHEVLQAIRCGSLRRQELPLALGSVSRLFGCTGRRHAFDVPPHGWARFREPQLTAGIAHFLNSGPFRTRRERVRQFLASTMECTGAEPLARLLADGEVVAIEAVAEEARVDLVVQATLADGSRLGAVIEAKFDHHLTRGQLPKARRHAATRGQLPKARRHAATRGLTDGNAVFAVVLPHVADVGTAVFRKAANRQWCAISWWSLLSRLEARLTEDADDDAFRAFRHTLWRQTYG